MKTKVYEAKVLQLNLVDTVNELVKENFGDNFCIAKTGEVYVNDDKQPFQRYTGNWHITNNTLHVEIINK